MEGVTSIFSIFPRVGAIVLAIILLIVSAATIGVIRNNDDLQDVLDIDLDDFPNIPDSFEDDIRELQNLIIRTQAAAGWLIAMSIGVTIAEIIAIVLVIVNLQGTGKLVVAVLEIIFSVLVILAYLGTGISCAVYAAAWGGPPDLCDQANDNPDIDDDDICDAIPLTATNALQTGFCFIQIGVFGLIVFMTAFGVMRSRSQAA